MADPKYAGLPGIVYDQPDMYETGDPTEGEAEYGVLEGGADTSSAVEVLHISAGDAHAQFKGKVIDASHVDFSDRISRSRRRGYDARRVEWEMVGAGEEETVVQKYQRLQCEVNQLLEEVQGLKETVVCGDGTALSADLGHQVEELHRTLVNTQLEHSLGPDLVAAISLPQHSLQHKLVNLLESFKQTGMVREKQQEERGGREAGGSGVVYELHYGPQHARLNQLATTATLEHRVDQLETLIGHNPDKLSSLAAWTNHRSVVGAVQVLSARLALLEPAHLDHVESRLHAIHTRMNTISEKRAAIDEADKQSKVCELYELVKKTEALCSALPEVTNRLMSLEALHHQAMQFSVSLKQLDVAQTRLSATLQSNADLLAGVQAKFTHNLAMINSNISNLDTRVQALKKE